MSEIQPGDWVEITLRVQVKTIDRYRSPYTKSPEASPFTAIVYRSGDHLVPDGDGGWKPTPNLYTLEIPDVPESGVEATITKES